MSTVANLLESKGHSVLTVRPGLPVLEAVIQMANHSTENYSGGSM